VRLFNETKEALEQQTATGEVLAAMSGSMTDTQPVFEKIVQSLRRLFGTRFTMEGGFYASVFEPAGIQVVLPNESERAYIHEKYMNELIPGVFLDETRARLTAIIEALQQRSHVDGLILGGTELPLILKEQSYGGVGVLDTTRIHVEGAIERMLE